MFPSARDILTLVVRHPSAESILDLARQCR
jgi:hypothetical protein